MLVETPLAEVEKGYVASPLRLTSGYDARLGAGDTALKAYCGCFRWPMKAAAPKQSIER